MRLLVLARHAETTLNHQQRVNGDPSVPTDLTEAGRSQARLLGEELGPLPIELCVHTRFGRTRVTAELALEGRDVPRLEEPLLDDIKIGDLEGWSIDDYRAWKRAHTRRDRFPAGESLDEAARRYAAAFERLAARPEDVILVVAHEIPIRYALNAARRSYDLDAPVHDVQNARPYLFAADALHGAARHIEQLVA